MEHVVWVEKYRPKTIQSCILPSNLKNIFQGIIDSKEIPNMILSGGPGMGKTTVAKAICNQLNIDYIMLNASDERGIDVLRTKVKQFASSMSMGKGRKIVIFDEADNLTPDMQDALRGAIEEFSSNCGFILTCNFKNKIRPALHSRCAVKDFKIPKEERKQIFKELFESITTILNKEKIKFDPKVLVELIGAYFPDYRRLINELQAYSKSKGEINSGILGISLEIDVTKLFKALKNKEFNSVREWVTENLDNEPSRIYRKLYDGLKNYMKTSSIPQAILLIQDYQYQAAFSADQEICLFACLIRIMSECEWT